MKLGIVGLPNVGKSTLFNAITKAGAEAAEAIGKLTATKVIPRPIKPIGDIVSIYDVDEL